MSTADEQPSLGVVLNDLDLSVPLPCDLSGWSLERPTIEQVHSYREVLSTFFAAQHFAGNAIGSPYEARKTGTNNTGVTPTWDLPPDQWRYTIVRRVAALIDAEQLTQALRLSDADIWIWTPFWPSSQSRTAGSTKIWIRLGNPNEVFQFFSRWWNTDKMPECPDLAEIVEVVELRRMLDDQYPEIARTLRLFIETDALPEFRGYAEVAVGDTIRLARSLTAVIRCANSRACSRVCAAVQGAAAFTHKRCRPFGDGMAVPASAGR